MSYSSSTKIAFTFGEVDFYLQKNPLSGRGNVGGRESEKTFILTAKLTGNHLLSLS